VFIDRKTAQEKFAFGKKMRSQQYETNSDLSLSSNMENPVQMHKGQDKMEMKSQPLTSKRVIPSNYEPKSTEEERFTNSERALRSRAPANRANQFSERPSNVNSSLAATYRPINRNLSAEQAFDWNIDQPPRQARQPQFDFAPSYDSSEDISDSDSNSSSLYAHDPFIHHYQTGEYDYYHDPSSLTGQALVQRHHLIWRNSRGQSQQEEPNMELNFIAPSFARESEAAPPAGHRRHTFNTRNSNYASYYQGSPQHFSPENHRQLHGNAPLVNHNGPSSPGMVPTMWRGADSQEGQDERPSVEIKQTIKTEYKIRHNGVVFTGAINETNIWGSHLHPEY
jgi:hypothetical protein